jgi:hypothetical protein
MSIYVYVHLHVVAIVAEEVDGDDDVDDDADVVVLEDFQSQFFVVLKVLHFYPRVWSHQNQHHLHEILLEKCCLYCC